MSTMAFIDEKWEQDCIIASNTNPAYGKSAESLQKHLITKN